MKRSWDPFDQEFPNLNEKNVKKVARRFGAVFIAYIIFVVSLATTVVGFVCWGIYKLVTHFAP